MTIDFIGQNGLDGSALEYSRQVESIITKTKEFINKINRKINIYIDHNNTDSFKAVIISDFGTLYTDIMTSIGIKNKTIVTSLRNAIEHGNYEPTPNDEIYMYDQIDHTNDSTIKFKTTVKTADLFNIATQLDSKISMHYKYTIADFLSELRPLLGEELCGALGATINSYSSAICGTALDLNSSFEEMQSLAVGGMNQPKTITI